MHPDQFWENGQILWSFVSSGDESAKDALYTDPDVGLTKDDVDTIKLAMQQIEDVSCINFTLGQPTKGDPWLFISRDARASDLECQRTHIQNNIAGTDIAGMGDIYWQLRWGSTECFPGAYAWYGSRSPQNFVISQTTMNKNSQGSIGLAVHELLHNLGMGHTQKRQDAKDNIKINWDNIKKESRYNYAPCEVDRDQRCSRYDHYGTEYDCSSIMHYGEWAFGNGKGKTMEPLPHRIHDCNFGGSELRPADIEIINKMYKCNGPIVEDSVITSPNYPANYPAGQDKQWRLEAESGSKVSLKFTDFILEENRCDFDWVRVEDGDGTELMNKTCGSNLPGPVVSNTNVMVVKFHTDWSDHFKGFRAEWEKVKSGPVTAGGTIKSPNHPAPYPHDNDTTFHLEVSPGSVIQLTFTAFSVEVEPESGCIFDYVEILDTDPAPTTKLCGHNLPSTVTSTGNKMTVHFHSDNSVNFPGFSANWEEVSV